MGISDFTDTDKKIITKDHDILIEIYTIQKQMVGRLDDYIHTDNEKHDRTSVEATSTKIEIALLRADVRGLQDDVAPLAKETGERFNKLEAKSFRFDLIAGMGVVIATVIAIIK